MSDKAAEILRKFNEWRREPADTPEDQQLPMPSPVEIGLAIDELLAERIDLKEENERLKESARLQKLNNENAYQEIDLVQMENRTLKARVAELEAEKERLQSYYENQPEG